MNALELTKSLAGVGSVGLVLWALTQLGEKWPWYQALSKQGKQIVAATFSSLVGLSAWAAVTYLPDSFWLSIQAPFAVVATIVTTIIGGDLLHFLTNKWGPTINLQAQAVDAIKESGAVLIAPVANMSQAQAKLAESGSIQPVPQQGTTAIDEHARDREIAQRFEAEQNKTKGSDA